MRQLNEMTLRTFHYSKRAMEFGLIGILPAREIVRKRLGTKVQKGLPERGIAITACFPSM